MELLNKCKKYIISKFIKLGSKKYNNIKIFPKSVLIVETNCYHTETLIGVSEYFIKAGYNVDIFMRDIAYIEFPFCRYKKKNIRIFPMSEKELKLNVTKSKLAQYDFIFFNSFVYNCEKYVEDYLIGMQQPRYSVLGIEHDILEKSQTKYPMIKQKIENKELFVISNCQNVLRLNPHYYGDIVKTQKNKKITVFVAIGVIDSSVKDHGSLICSIRDILKEGYTNFKVIIIGKGNLSVPKELQKYIEFKGRLNFPDMFNEIEKADYLLALMNINNISHHRYLQGQASGILQLSLGFQKPLVINNVFGEHYELSKKNAIFYEDNLLSKALKEAINLSHEDYSLLQYSLQFIAAKIQYQSIKDLLISIKNAKQKDFAIKIK